MRKIKVFIKKGNVITLRVDSKSKGSIQLAVGIRVGSGVAGNFILVMGKVGFLLVFI